MKVLFDQGTPVPLRRALDAHVVSTAYEMGWSALSNGELLTAADAAGFECLVTTDKSLRHQQKLEGRRVRVVVLPTTDWASIRRHTEKVVAAVGSARPGEVLEVLFDD